MPSQAVENVVIYDTGIWVWFQEFLDSWPQAGICVVHFTNCQKAYAINQDKEPNDWWIICAGRGLVPLADICGLKWSQRKHKSVKTVIRAWLDIHSNSDTHSEHKLTYKQLVNWNCGLECIDHCVLVIWSHNPAIIHPEALRRAMLQKKGKAICMHLTAHCAMATKLTSLFHWMVCWYNHGN